MLPGVQNVAWPAGSSARLSRLAGRGGFVHAVAKILFLGVGAGRGFLVVGRTLVAGLGLGLLRSSEERLELVDLGAEGRNLCDAC